MSARFPLSLLSFVVSEGFEGIKLSLIARYYEGGVSSVYMWEDDNEGFVACFLIKKGDFLTPVSLGANFPFNPAQ